MSLEEIICVDDDSEDVIAFLAARSASLFSFMLECPGIQTSLILKFYGILRCRFCSEYIGQRPMDYMCFLYCCQSEGVCEDNSVL